MRGTLKLIDFGIAKATNQELTEKTIYTQHRQMIGTPAYMSPEQAEMSGLDIDTRSDIYSMGVLLYELLTGTTPISNEELASAGYEGLTRMIREVEPHKPSTRISSLRDVARRTAELRRADVQRLRLRLRGDLDWIVMKCLEKDRTRRYETATGLAVDIQRHLEDQPVNAGPPSAAYKLRKFVRRNRGRVIAGSVVGAALVLGAFGTTIGLIRALDEKSRADEAAEAAVAARDRSDREREAAEDARKAAEAQLARSEEFKGFMMELLRSIQPNRESPERSVAIRELIDTAYEKLQDGDVRDATARAELMALLDATAGRHGWYDLLVDLRRAQLDEAQRLYGRDDPRTISTAISLAYGFLPAGRASEIRRIVLDDIPGSRAIREAPEASRLHLE
ncbi:MAG: protein kinase, partial [Planctomycetota bacterium]